MPIMPIWEGWDGTKKPVWNTLRETTLIDRRTQAAVQVATFSVVPYDSIEECQIYNKALKRFRSEKGKEPLSARDFEYLRCIIEKSLD